ncbi:MAG: mechanosensitive ion channel domain-containing protein [Xenococcaceae cyanobacterium]
MNIGFQQLFTGFSNILKAIRFQVGDRIISLSSIFQLILYGVIVIFLIRFLKKFLKRRLLVKLGIDQGSRESLASIISYSIGSLGFVIILQTTGFNLSSLAVIGGGLGIGIGFGLKSLTKNFVSGLTLLIERNVKAGDFVEFDGLEGYVKEISTRSTIIRTKDGGDMVVPNSQLVENRLINWSHESFVARIHIPAGVAYGSDPVLVTEALLKSAYMEANVLHDPPPQVMFMGFGDNSLNFELWVWVSRIDRHPDIRSSLNFIIEYNLRQQKIKIPFPQRDLWLRNPEVFTESLLQTENGQNSSPLSQPLVPVQSVEAMLPRLSSQFLSVRDLLRQVTYFSKFNELELRKLIEIGYRKRLRASEILFRENDPGDAFYIILSGSVEVFVEKIDKHLTTLQAGNFLGELSLMLGIPRTATVKALEDTILFSINKNNFQKLLHEHRELYEVIVQELAQHQAELLQRQRQLRDLGLWDKTEDDTNIVVWVRKRLKKIFSL